MRVDKKNFVSLGRMRNLLGVLLCGLILNAGFSFSEEIRYQPGGRRDPFVPIRRNAVIAATINSFKIEGILYDRKGESLVTIHSETYKVGDTVNEHKIVAIHPNKIIVELKGVQNEYWISSSDEDLAKQASK